MSEPFSELLKRARKANGMTQEQLAAALHVSRQTVSHWENGRSEPSLQTLQQLRDLLHADLDPRQQEPSDESPQGESPVPHAGQAAQPALRIPRWVIGILAAALLAVLAAWSLYLSCGPYSLRWFREAASEAPGAPFMRMYIHEEAIDTLSSNDGRHWEFPLFFKAEGQTTFHIDGLRCVWFLQNGKRITDDLSGADFAAFIGSHSIAGGQCRFGNFGQLADSPITAFGCEVSCSDDQGNAYALRFLHEKTD